MTKSVTIPTGKATLTWFEEIFEEYNTNLEYKQPICSQEKGLDN
ncbi:hypothetical protein [Streptococcus pneumoniae]|nr:hypothetical protein [Streptococcus pneumoniae]